MRAACTTAGDDDTDDEEEEGDDQASLLDRCDGDERSSNMGTNDIHNESHEIEVPAEDFYENEAPDPKFLASLHAFPLKELTGAAVSAAPQSKNTNIGNPSHMTAVAAGAVTSKPGVPPNLANIKYRFQHSGKT